MAVNDLNKVLIIGNLTKDPELKALQNSNVVNFTLAVNETYTSNGEKVEKANFFDFQAWGKTADTLNQFAKKGTKLCVEGKLKQQTWQDQDGNKKSKIVISVQSFQFLGGGKQNGNSQGKPQGSKPQQGNHVNPEDIF